MGDGVSPVGDRKLLDGEEETEDVYEDALMETTVDESEPAATTAVEEKTRFGPKAAARSVAGSGESLPCSRTSGGMARLSHARGRTIRSFRATM